MIWPLCVRTILVLASIVAGDWTEQRVRLPLQALAVKEVFSGHKDIPVITHDKEPGEGYSPGSPLYKKQERLKRKKLKQEANTVVEGKPSVYDPAVGPAGAGEVSTALWCVIGLACQYFAVYTVLMVVSTVAGKGGNEEPSLLYKTLEAATATVNYAPMLCILFISVRMRAIQLTQGETKKYELPQPWVREAMQVCAWSVLAQLIVVLLIPLFTGSEPVTDSDGNIDHNRIGSPQCAWIFVILRFVIMLGLYGGYIAVCVGTLLMEAPKELYPDGTPPVSPAVSCVINLTTQYFIVYLLLAIFRTWNQIKGYSHTKASDTLQLAAYTVNFAPMLCILFVGARMRALQIDPLHGNPQSWAQACFYMCTYSVLVQTILVICVPIFLGGRCHKGTSEGDISFELRNRNMSMLLDCVRWIAMVCLYGGFSTIIVSVLLIEDKENPEKTPELSPAMQCIIHLTIQFFAVYLALWLAISIRQWTRTENDFEAQHAQSSNAPLEILEMACHTVMFCPMLCVLFLAARMRALQLTRNRGAPPGWAQDAMRLATLCVLAQLIVVLAQFCPGCGIEGHHQYEHDPLDSLGDEERIEKERKPAKICREFMRFLFLAGMYVGAGAVILAIFTMNAENANGTGSYFFGRDARTPYL